MRPAWSSLEQGKKLQHFLLDRVANSHLLCLEQGQGFVESAEPPYPNSCWVHPQGPGPSTRWVSWDESVLRDFCHPPPEGGFAIVQIAASRTLDPASGNICCEYMPIVFLLSVCSHSIPKAVLFYTNGCFYWYTCTISSLHRSAAICVLSKRTDCNAKCRLNIHLCHPFLWVRPCHPRNSQITAVSKSRTAFFC